MKTKYIIIIVGIVVFLFISRFILPKQVPKPVEIAQVVDTLTYTEKFDKKQFSDYGNVYKPVRNYLQKTVNDPSSLEIVNTWNNGMNKDSTVISLGEVGE